MSDAGGGARYDGQSAAALERLLDVPRVILAGEVDSTMDVAHALAGDGVPAGTLVLAESQRRGRGRAGKAWISPSGGGIWMTLVERPSDAAAIEVLSLRVGLRAAAALDRYAGEEERVRVKWPNDLMVAAGKLAGILVEARWRASRPEWVAIGLGVNVSGAGAAGNVPGGASLGAPVSRAVVLAELVPALRAAATARGPLTPGELDAFAARDWARGRRAVAPARGVVRGISEAGALLVDDQGVVHACASGSLILEEAER